MQSQFFDQAIHGWRSTGDEELGRLLYPALELHTKWQDECFDPDEDGLYESYINTWQTDSVWYSGGGSAEETAMPIVRIRQRRSWPCGTATPLPPNGMSEFLSASALPFTNGFG